MLQDRTLPQGSCVECGEPNPYSALICYECGARLPWADALEAAALNAAALNAAALNAAALAAALEAARRSGDAPSPDGTPAPAHRLAAPAATAPAGTASAGTAPGPTPVARRGVGVPRPSQPLPSDAPTPAAPALHAPAVNAPPPDAARLPAGFIQAPHPSPGEPVLVSVAARLLDWPYTCACCGQSLEGPAAVGHKVVRVSTQVGQVPYCATCARHIELANEADNTFGCCVLLASLGLFPFFLLFRSLADSTQFGLVGALLSCVALVLWGFQVRQAKLQAARGLANVGCCDLRYAVVPKGGADTNYSFLFKRPEYAAAFVQANHHKVIPQS